MRLLPPYIGHAADITLPLRRQADLDDTLRDAADWL